MGIFDRFPSTKLNDINLDWVLKKLRAFRGGTTNQVLAKASNADFDFKWITGGGGGTSDYNNLINQPQINSVTLTGDQSAADLGLLDAGALNDYRTAAAQDLLDAAKQAKITASGILKGDGDGGVAAAAAGIDYLAPAALNDYRTAAAQDLLDAAKQAKITASGILKGDGNGGVAAAAAGIDYLAPAALNDYRTAAAQDLLDAAQDANIGIVITGARPSMVVSAGQYVIVRGSTITGITDGLYKAINALSPSTDVTAADLDSASTSHGGLNAIQSYFARSSISLTKVANQISDVERAVCFVSGNIAQLSLTFTVSSTITNNTATLFSGAPRGVSYFRTAFFTTDRSPTRIRLSIEYGTIKNAYTAGGIPAGQYEGTVTYILEN